METLIFNASLSKIAANRDLLSTDEYATQIGRAPQTIRKNHSQTGEAFGIRPVKIGNRLMWRISDVTKLIEGGEVK
jgi:hypothetical protein